MRVIGLDLSLRATGIAVKMDDTPLHWETCEVEGTGLKRLDEITQWVLGWTWYPEIFVVIEGLGFASNMPGHSEIVGLAYLVRHRLWRRDIPFLLVAPMQLKKFVTGKGVSEKSLILREVYRKFGALVSNDNEADAVALSMIGQALLGLWEPTAVTQHQVLEKLRASNPEMDLIHQGVRSQVENIKSLAAP